jgi:hypothetical protein
VQASADVSVDPETFEVVQSFSVGGLPQHVTPSYDLETLYVNTNTGNTLQRIDPARPPRRDVRGDHSCDEYEQEDPQVDGRLGARDAEELAAQQACDHEGCDRSHTDAEGDDPNPLAEDEENRIGGSGAERHSHPHFSCALPDGESDPSVEADDREDEGGECTRAYQAGAEAALGERGGEHLGEGADVRQRERGVHDARCAPASTFAEDDPFSPVSSRA